MKFKQLKQQVSVDFLSSYGVAIAVMLVAFIAMYTIAIAPNNPSVFCTPAPGFNCNFLSLDTQGVLTLKFAQATGTQLTINGVACSSQQNSQTDTPQYGNTEVNSLTQYYVVPQYYPPGNMIYSGNTTVIHVYCYEYGGTAKGKLGQVYTGYIWLNYSIPNYGEETQKIATFSTVYS